MKKTLAFLFASAILTRLYAMDVGTLPPQGERVTLKAGFGYVVTRELKSNNPDAETDFSSVQIRFKAGFNPFDRIEIYGNAGFADAGFKGSGRKPLAFLFGGGVAFSLLDPAEEHNIIFGGQADYYKPENSIVLDYQFSATYVHLTKIVIPYAGVKYSDTLVKNTDGGQDWQAKNKVGIVIGVQYFVNPDVFFTAEMHNFDQDAFYGGVGFRF